jgi:ribosome-binding factor A
MKSRRLAKLNSLIRERVAELLLYELKDPRLGFLTVLRVEVTKDTQFASIYVSVLGNEAQKRTALRALEHCSGYVSCEIGKILNIRSTPKCRFYMDDSAEKQIYMEQRIKEVIEKDQSPP